MTDSSSHLHDSTSGRRSESRLRVRLEARIITHDGTSRTVMADISYNGARVMGDLPRLRRGQQLIIQWHGFEAFGYVAWSEGRQSGLQFDEPLPQAVLIRTRQIQDQSPLASEREQARGAARAFVQGKVRL